MRKLLPILCILCLSLASCVTCEQENAQLRQQVAKLTAGNRALAGKLRATAQDVDGLTAKLKPEYWLTLSTQKRHKKGCPYFGKSAGKKCSPTNDTPCG